MPLSKRFLEQKFVSCREDIQPVKKETEHAKNIKKIPKKEKMRFFMPKLSVFQKKTEFS